MSLGPHHSHDLADTPPCSQKRSSARCTSSWARDTPRA